MSGSDRAKCPNIAWAFWMGVEHQLPPAEQVTLNAIAELADDELYCKLTLAEMDRYTRLKRGTLGPAMRKLAELKLIRVRRGPDGYHYWLLRETPNGGAHVHPWQELSRNVPVSEVENLNIAPSATDVQNLNIAPATDAQNLNIAPCDAQNLQVAKRNVTKCDAQNLRLDIKTPLKTPVSPESGNIKHLPLTHTSRVRACEEEVDKYQKWEEFIAAYPANDGSLSSAKSAYAQVLAEGVDPQVLIDAVKTYPFRSPQRFVIHPVNWLTQRRWEAKVESDDVVERIMARFEAEGRFA